MFINNHQKMIVIFGSIHNILSAKVADSLFKSIFDVFISVQTTLNQTYKSAYERES